MSQQLINAIKRSQTSVKELSTAMIMLSRQKNLELRRDEIKKANMMKIKQPRPKIGMGRNPYKR